MKYLITVAILTCMICQPAASSRIALEEQISSINEKSQLALLTQEQPNMEETEVPNEITEADVPSINPAEKPKKEVKDEGMDYSMFILLGGGILILLGILLALRKRNR
jgi:hypothetical protein